MILTVLCGPIRRCSKWKILGRFEGLFVQEILSCTLRTRLNSDGYEPGTSRSIASRVPAVAVRFRSSCQTPMSSDITLFFAPVNLSMPTHSFPSHLRERTVPEGLYVSRADLGGWNVFCCGNTRCGDLQSRARLHPHSKPTSQAT